jgi:hypothetical protein
MQFTNFKIRMCQSSYIKYFYGMFKSIAFDHPTKKWNSLEFYRNSFSILFKFPSSRSKECEKFLKIQNIFHEWMKICCHILIVNCMIWFQQNNYMAAHKKVFFYCVIWEASWSLSLYIHKKKKQQKISVCFFKKRLNNACATIKS